MKVAIYSRRLWHCIEGIVEANNEVGGEMLYVSIFILPVSQTGMSFMDVRFMTPLPPDELSKGEEQTRKDRLENYRPVRQRTARSETTKDKAGILPPVMYSNANPNATARDFFPADQVEQTPTASSEMRSVVSDVSVLSFVSDATVPLLHLASTADFNQARVVQRVFNAIKRIAWFVL